MEKQITLTTAQECYSKAKKNVEALEQLPKSGYLYYTGSQGREFAIDNKRWKSSYIDAVKELAMAEEVTEEDIINDYQNWYYIELISEALESESYDLKYYAPTNNQITTK